MANCFTEKVCELIRAIPYGSVTTYGLVARAAGNPRGARQVARILHSCGESGDLPWHRVVNRHGLVPPRSSMHHLFQIESLREEGVTFDDKGHVELSSHLWIP